MHWPSTPNLPALQWSRPADAFLVRGMPCKTYEAGLNQRTIVLEFDSVERAIAAFNGDAYKAALKVLGNGAERDIRLVEGVA